MAFAGFNVTFGLIYLGKGVIMAPIYGDIVTSHNMSVAGTSNVAAPNYPSGDSKAPIASCHSAVDAWVTVGQTPSDPAVDGARRFVPAYSSVGGPTDFMVKPGDKVRWAPA